MREASLDPVVFLGFPLCFLVVQLMLDLLSLHLFFLLEPFFLLGFLFFSILVSQHQDDDGDGGDDQEDPGIGVAKL